MVDRDAGLAITEATRTLLRSPARALFGFDIFISYARSDGAAYAELLEARLETVGFTVFRDRHELNVGDPLDHTVTAAIQRSRRFVLVDTMGARVSPWVAKELTSFLESNHAGVVQIRVGHIPDDCGWPLLRGAAVEPRLRDLIWVSESEKGHESNRPSDITIKEIERCFRTIRVRQYMRATVGAVIIALSTLTAVSTWKTFEALAQSRIASSRELVAYSLSNLEDDPELSILFALRAVMTTWSHDHAVLPEAELVMHRALNASRVRTRISGADGDFTSVAWSADGRWVATGSRRKTTQIWDAQTGRLLRTLAGPAAVQEVAWSPDSARLATASSDGQAIVWDVKTGRQLLALTAHRLGTLRVAWSPDGARIATAGGDATVKVWNAATGHQVLSLVGNKRARCPAEYSGRNDLSRAFVLDHCRINAITWSPDGRFLAAAGGDDIARVWDAATGAMVRAYSGHNSRINGIDWSPEGDRIVTSAGDFVDFSADNTAKVWDPKTGKELFSLPGQDSYLEDVAWDKRGRYFATAGHDGIVRVWGGSTGREVATLTGHTASIAKLRWSPDGVSLATAADDSTVRIWRIYDIDELPALTGHKDHVESVAWSPDSKRVASTSWDHTARIWDAETGRQLVGFTGHDSVVVAASWSADGRRVATAGWDGKAKIWDSSTGQEIQTLTSQSGVESILSNIAWSPDGARIATTGWDGKSRVWDATGGTLLLTLNLGAKSHAVAWSPDNRQLATGSMDGRLRIWDAISGKEL